MANQNTTIDFIDQLENIEDGIKALYFIANVDRGNVTDDEEFTNAYNYVSNKVLDDMQTIRAKATTRLSEEQSLRIAK